MRPAATVCACRARTAASCEAVIVNTGGGMAGGDACALPSPAPRGRAATLTTTAAEKIYRAEERADARRPRPRGRQRRHARMAAAGNHPVRRGAARRAAARSTSRQDATLLLAEMPGLRPPRHGRGDALRRGCATAGACGAPAARLCRGAAIEGDIAATLDRPALGGGARASATVLARRRRAPRRSPRRRARGAARRRAFGRRQRAGTACCSSARFALARTIAGRYRGGPHGPAGPRPAARLAT